MQPSDCHLIVKLRIAGRKFLRFEARNVRMNPGRALGLEPGEYFVSILPKNGKRITL